MHIKNFVCREHAFLISINKRPGHKVEQLKNKDARESRSLGLLGVSKLSQMQTTPNPASHSLCQLAKGLRVPVFKCSEPAEHQQGRPLLIYFPLRCVCSMDADAGRYIERRRIAFRSPSALVDLLLLVHAQLAGAHVNEEDQATTVEFISVVHV